MDHNKDNKVSDNRSDDPEEQSSSNTSGLENKLRDNLASDGFSAEDLDIEDNRIEGILKRIAFQKSVSTSSPIPPPEIIEAYDKLDPVYSKTYLDEWVTTNATKRDLDRGASKIEDHKVVNQFSIEIGQLENDKERIVNDRKDLNNSHKQRILIIWLFAAFLFCLILLAFVSMLLGQTKLGIGSLLVSGAAVIFGIVRQIFVDKKR